MSVEGRKKKALPSHSMVLAYKKKKLINKTVVVLFQQTLLGVNLSNSPPRSTYNPIMVYGGGYALTVVNGNRKFSLPLGITHAALNDI